MSLVYNELMGLSLTVNERARAFPFNIPVYCYIRCGSGDVTLVGYRVLTILRHNIINGRS